LDVVFAAVGEVHFDATIGRASVVILRVAAKFIFRGAASSAHRHTRAQRLLRIAPTRESR
jgi:hypothetical protein